MNASPANAVPATAAVLLAVASPLAAVRNMKVLALRTGMVLLAALTLLTLRAQRLAVTERRAVRGARGYR